MTTKSKTSFLSKLHFYEVWEFPVKLFGKNYEGILVLTPYNLSFGGYFCESTKTLILTIPFVEISIGFNPKLSVTEFLAAYTKFVTKQQEKATSGQDTSENILYAPTKADKKLSAKKASKSSKPRSRKVYGDWMPIQIELPLGKTKSKKKFKK